MLKAPEGRKRKRPTERGELLEHFTEQLNKARKGTRYKPLTLRFIAVKTAHLSVPDLYHLKSICDKGDSFSRVFFGSLKPRDPADF